jgi:DNA-binding transcriptional ArsR family regulator
LADDDGAPLFAALADPTRRRILDELTQKDGQTLFEICTRLTMKYQVGSTRQAISQHLDVLEAIGLITTRRTGKYKFHYVNTKPLRNLTHRWIKQDK